MWGEALNFVVYYKNRSPIKVLNGMTLFKAQYGFKPRLDYIYTFGCVTYIYNTDPALRKLDNKSRKYKFLSYKGLN